MSSPPRRPAVTLGVAALGTLLVLAVFNVPLGTLAGTAAGIHASPGSQAWILSAMSLGCAAGLLTSGAIGDDHGRRGTFVGGAVVLALGSALAALAPGAVVLIAGRVVQGLGGAAILACSLGLISTAFPPGHARARATAVWGASIGGGVALGPLAAVGLESTGGWRLAYWLSAVSALLIGTAGRGLLTESRAPERRPVDVAGALLLGSGLAGILAGLVEGRGGWARPSTVVLILSGLALLAGFTLTESRSTVAMFDLGLLRQPDFTGVTAAAVATGLGVLGLMNVVPTFVERGLGHSPTYAATVLLAWSAVSAVTALLARHLPPSLLPRKMLVGGLLGVTAGQLALTGLSATTSIVRLLPGLFVVGAANGVLNVALGQQAVATVPAHRAAMGSGANSTARYIGTAVGITVCVLITDRPGKTSPAAVTHGFNTAALVTSAFSLMGTAVVWISHRRQPRFTRLNPAP